MANRIIGSLLTNCCMYDVCQLRTEVIFKKILKVINGSKNQSILFTTTNNCFTTTLYFFHIFFTVTSKKIKTPSH